MIIAIGILSLTSIYLIVYAVATIVDKKYIHKLNDDEEKEE